MLTGRVQIIIVRAVPDAVLTTITIVIREVPISAIMQALQAVSTEAAVVMAGRQEVLSHVQVAVAAIADKVIIGFS